jgi:antitoxin ParD1/3/4
LYDCPHASEAISDALRILQRKRQEDSLNLKALRVLIEARIAALERGDFTEIADTEHSVHREVYCRQAGKL